MVASIESIVVQEILFIGGVSIVGVGPTLWWRTVNWNHRAENIFVYSKKKNEVQTSNNIIENGSKQGRHRQSTDQQQTPVTQQSAVQPATSSSVQQGRGTSASLATKMATRAAQGSAIHTLTRNANKAKVALRSQKPPTNNNMIIRRKSKANEVDIKSTVSVQQQPSSTNPPQCVPDSSPKQVGSLHNCWLYCHWFNRLHQP